MIRPNQIRNPGLGKERHAHVLVAETAKAMAGALYEKMMEDNSRYAAWKAQCPDLTPEALEAEFIRRTYPKLLDQARATLAKMLSGPLPSGLKDQIADALILDNGLQRGRKRGAGLRLNHGA